MSKLYENIDGTTRPSFKIGPRGIVLTSQILNDSDKKKLFANNIQVITKEDIPTVESDEFDVSLPLPTISGYVKGSDSLTIILSNGDSIKIPTVFTVQGVLGPDQSTPGNLVTFNCDNGSSIDDSGYKITEKKLSEITNEDSSSIATAISVKEYVGDITDILGNRLSGK